MKEIIPTPRPQSLIAFFAVLALLSQGSCGLAAEAEVSYTRSQLADLEIGQSKEEVIQHMGPAWKTEAFQRKGDTYLLLYYRTQRIPGDFRVTIEEMTPLLFRDQKLIGWGLGVLELME